MPKTQLVRSYAKINIALNVLDKLDTGYHTLDMVMLPLEIHDSLYVQKLKNARDNYITVDDFSVGPVKYNLATFAIDALAAKYKFPDKFRIFVHKVIPMEAGLGGGSSNAAATLTGVNEYLKLGLNDNELIKIGAKLGSDIPFFIKGVPARVSGTGEKVEPITVKNDYYCILVKPPVGLSSKEVYDRCDLFALETCDIDAVIKALEEGDDELLASSINNSLQPVSIALCPEIQIIIDLLHEKGLKIVQLSGSGSCVFGLSTDKKLIKKVAKEIEDQYETVEVTKVRK
ncbi:MAG: 4-(cytidine 5'-diphospho)-2-C-methyl-D-erythritol kinase [Coprobacillus sp.]|nr:4-(cytidine 5'-diphospho)-2-C-methyl-D-erythritol kinase [Coprobacillus sp.]